MWSAIKHLCLLIKGIAKKSFIHAKRGYLVYPHLREHAYHFHISETTGHVVPRSGCVLDPLTVLFHMVMGGERLHVPRCECTSFSSAPIRFRSFVALKASFWLFNFRVCLSYILPIPLRPLLRELMSILTAWNGRKRSQVLFGLFRMRKHCPTSCYVHALR